MVRILNYKKRSKDDKDFFVLEVTGGIELVQSQTTGQFYATSKKAYLSSTFDEQTCKALIGTEIAGNIEKQECEPYEYTVKDTGEVILLNHRYVYVAETIPTAKIPEPVKVSEPIRQSQNQDFATEMETFSKNGKYELEKELV